MPTISIPYFELAEPASSSTRSNGVWNEIRVPLAPQLPASTQADRSSSRGASKPQVSFPIGSKPDVLLPQISPAPASSLQPKPIAPTTRNTNSANVDSVMGDTRSAGDLKLAQVDTTISQQPTPAIVCLTDCILERFPIAGPTIILFAGTQSNPLTSATCANVAYSLARKKVGEILLVDSCQQKELSQTYQAADHRGLSNLLTDHADWQSAVVKLASSGLEFLPAGTSHWEHWGAEGRLRQLAAELRRQYQFVCVAVDDPHLPNSRIWNGICDGSFLLVSQRNANPAVAESTVVEMQSNGARLLGCVVTDADSILP